MAFLLEHGTVCQAKESMATVRMGAMSSVHGTGLT